MKLKTKVVSTIKRFSLFPPNAKVLCAVSGGPDSVALLSVLHEISQKEYPMKLYVAHFNHGIRDESNEEEIFVIKLCESLNIPIFTEKETTIKFSKKGNMEAIARQKRYGFLYRTAGKINVDVIATGHTASDLTETVLFNLTKGSGIKGMRGFLPKRDKIIRPLFEVSRKEVETYLNEKNISYVIDSSNFSLKFSRNLIRIKVVPILTKINPSLEKTILRETEIFREMEHFVQEEIKKIIGKAKFKNNSVSLDITCLQNLHPFLLKETVQELFHRLTNEHLNNKKLKAIETLVYKNTSGFINLKNGYIFYKDQHFATVMKKNKETSKIFFIPIDEVTKKVETPLGTFFINTENPDFEIPLNEFKKGLFIKTRQEGDWMQFPYGRKKLKKFLIEKKIPVKSRKKLLMLSTKEKEIVWIPGIFKKTYINGNKEKIGMRFESGTKNHDNGI